MEVVLSENYGFCTGIKRALEIIKKTRKDKDGEVNVFKEIAHNKYVVNQLKEQGIGSVSSLKNIEGTIIIRTHGVDPKILDEARRKNLDIIDVVCPFVIRIHELVKNLTKKGYMIILIGDKKHDETLSVKAESPKNIRIISNVMEARNLSVNSGRLAVIAQSTLNTDDFISITDILKRKFPRIRIYNTICNDTKIRQNDVKKLAKQTDLIIVVGSPTSANSKRLVQVAKCCNKPSYLVNDENCIKAEWFSGIKKVGVTSGASTPDEIIHKVIKRIKKIR